LVGGDRMAGLTERVEAAAVLVADGGGAAVALALLHARRVRATCVDARVRRELLGLRGACPRGAGAVHDNWRRRAAAHAGGRGEYARHGASSPVLREADRAWWVVGGCTRRVHGACRPRSANAGRPATGRRTTGLCVGLHDVHLGAKGAVDRLRVAVLGPVLCPALVGVHANKVAARAARGAEAYGG